MRDFSTETIKVLTFLAENPGKWFGLKGLAKAHGFPHNAQQVVLRQHITEEIHKGAPIISGSKGVLWASQSNQLAVSIKRDLARAEAIRARAEAKLIIYVRLLDEEMNRRKKEPFRCHYCPFTSTDGESVFKHEQKCGR